MLHLFLGDFKPPRMHLSAELELVLLITFGTRLAVRRLPTSMSAALQWARCLGIVEPFVRRLTELAQVGSGEPQAQQDIANINSAALLRLARIKDANERLNRAVSAGNVDLVLLDAPVLAEHNNRTHLPRASDLCALIRADDQQKVSAALVDVGLDGERRGTGNSTFGVFGAPEAEAISLQLDLPFVRMVPGGVFVDLACLKRCGLLEPVAVSHGCGLWRPSLAVRVAFLLAQALVERRFDPNCNLLRLLLATSELGFGDNEDLAFDVYLLVQTDIEHAEFEAWRELTRALACSELSGLSVRARVLLHHAVAAAHSPAYRLRLHAQQKAQKWQHDGNADRLAATLGRAINRLRRRP